MPLFSFKCLECSQEFEELVKSNTKIDDITCPQCTSDNVQRQPSMVAALPKSTSPSGYCPTNPDCTTSG